MAKVLFVVCIPNIHDGKISDDDKRTAKGGKSENGIEKDKCNDIEGEHENKKKEKDIYSESSGEEPNVSEKKESESDDHKEQIQLSDDCPETQSTDLITESDTQCKFDFQNTEQTIDSDPIKDQPQFVRFMSQETDLLESVKRTLDILNVTGVQWNITEDDMHVAMFISDYGASCELIIKRLSMLKIGIIKNSSISVFPATICVQDESQEEDVATVLEREDKLNEKVSEFRKSIKSRLVVDQVVTSVQGDAVFTFDFLMLVILASFVAVMGLLEASSVVLVASMLISPLMGPILAAVFGTVIQKEDLIRVGVSSELRGLGICILVGFLLGFIPAGLEAGHFGWRSSLEWPTVEMSSRGALRSLPVGILIAIPSGAGVALSILGGKIGSLVGVAISASLLPPAVNAGLLWANAIIVAIFPPQGENMNSIGASSNITINGISDCLPLLHNDYVPLHSCNMAVESLLLGVVSLSLTILNIACIIFMGILVLKLKEVAPLFRTSARESEKDFFCKDLRIARESYVTTKGKNAAAMRQQWLSEYKNFKAQTKDDEDDDDAELEIDNIIESVQDSPAVIDIVDKMPVRPERWSRIALTSSNGSGTSSYFSFNPHDEHEEGFELSERHVFKSATNTPVPPRTPDAGGDTGTDSDAVYFTVHRFIHPRHLRSSATSSWKKGKLLKKLQVPQESRFLIAKIAEPPEEKRKPSLLSTLQEEESQAGSEKTEAHPLLTKQI